MSPPSSIKQDWLGISHYGLPILDENQDHHPFWVKSKVILYNGYQCQRLISNADDKKFYITNQVYKSSCGKPLFCTKIYTDSDRKNLLSTFNCQTTYVCYKKALKSMSINIKGRLNGDRFFGFTLKDYFNRPVLSTTDTTIINGNVLLDPSHDRISSCGGVISFGFPVFDDDRFVKLIGKNRCRLQPGYKAVRKMKVSEDRTVSLFLTIEKSTEGPLYTVYTEVEPLSYISTTVPNQTLKIYEQLGI
eukprot:TCONS_00032553-protein